MADNDEVPNNKSKLGDYTVLNNKRLDLTHHLTDFSVIGISSVLEKHSQSAAMGGTNTTEPTKSFLETSPLASNMTRVKTNTETDRDELMKAVRSETVAHHIYEVKETNEEIIIDDHIFLVLQDEASDELSKIISEYKLISEGKIGNAHVLRVTDATQRNPIKVANEISMREGVVSCTPQVLLSLKLSQGSVAGSHTAFKDQWHLTSDLIAHLKLNPTASINAPEAWQYTFGNPEIVIAVIDDGFDLTHPAFGPDPQEKGKIHPAKRNFSMPGFNTNPTANKFESHGTAVASVALASLEGTTMVGIAPRCQLLPIKVPMLAITQIFLLEVLQYVSAFADVVNCSFDCRPLTFDPLIDEVKKEIAQLAISGGRRERGLVMIFSAGNSDAPTFLPASKNKNGVEFRGGKISADQPIFSVFPRLDGIIVVGAMSSLKRKSGYSNWGPHLTVVAPSNNFHEVFVNGIEYPGLALIAANNRERFQKDIPETTTISETEYVTIFGGTSAAAPIVSGVAALMLSVNPDLTAEQVKQILMSTADRDLDPKPDFAGDPNLQDLHGEFVNGFSIFFGAGKVNAFHAVRRALALRIPHP